MVSKQPKNLIPFRTDSDQNNPPTVLFSNNPKAQNPKKKKIKKKKNTQRIETKLNMTKSIKKKSSILIYFPLFSKQPNKTYKEEIILRKFIEQWVR